MDELEALVILNHIPLLGSVKIRLLVAHYGSARAALKAPLAELGSFPGFGPKLLQTWEQGLYQTAWKQDLLLAEQLQVRLIPFTSPDYPKHLLEIVDPPPLLYVQGTLKQEDKKCLAVVGTRQASLYGQEMAMHLSQQLTRQGFTIISGLARGIDTAAHQGALKGGRTLAVLGSGLACLYPRENQGLAESIRQQGALISEFPMTTPPDRQHFPQRNRIVSGMAWGTVLIEAPLKSGAMNTAERALSQNRPVFVLPGRADQENFRGNHALIKEKKGCLIENVQDILSHFDEPSLPLVFYPSFSPQVALEKEEEELLKWLPAHEMSVEELLPHLRWPIAKLNVLLMSLVLKKRLKEYPGKIYKKMEGN